MLLFLVAEIMFFAGLVSAYIVLRSGTAVWRPQGLPPLARGLSVSNTVLLCLSAVSTRLSQRAVLRNDFQGLRLYLGVTLLIGLTFLGVQGYEFHRLHEMVPYSGNVFGSVFYTLSGLHGLHVAGGVVWLALVTVQALRGLYSKSRCVGVSLFALYWYFVVIVWVFLFFALYVW